jgi:motility quorum-sensing regulator/GCU-specific mRNA interferase toxin
MKGPKKAKGKPHHDLKAVKARFSCLSAPILRTSAIMSAQEAGLSPLEVLDVIQALKLSDFVKSAPGHTPSSPVCWHDTYEFKAEGRSFYLKFAGTSIADLRLTSFRDNV